MNDTTDHVTTTPEALDREIDRLAKAIVDDIDTAKNVQRAAILDTLMRYREDRATREHRARMAGPVPR